MNKDIYEYRLTYIDGDKECTHIFSAFIDAPKLVDNLRHFLLASSWSENMVDKIFRGEYNEQ